MFTVSFNQCSWIYCAQIHVRLHGTMNTVVNPSHHVSKLHFILVSWSFYFSIIVLNECLAAVLQYILRTIMSTRITYSECKYLDQILPNLNIHFVNFMFLFYFAPVHENYSTPIGLKGSSEKFVSCFCTENRSCSH